MPYQLLDDDNVSEDIAIAQSGARNVARQGLNLATLAIGFPGDILSLVDTLVAQPIAKYALGQETTPYEESPLGQLIPTTETHRKRLETAIGEEKTQPHNAIEQFGDNLIEDWALLANPSKLFGKKFPEVFKDLGKKFLVSLGANIAGEATEEFGGDESSKAAAKAGTLFLGSLMNPKSAAKQVGDIYQKAQAALPDNATTSGVWLGQKIDRLQHSITKGRPIENLSPPEKFVVDHIEKIRNLIQNGQINVSQAWAQKKSLHKALATLYKDVPGGSEQKNVKNVAKILSGYLNKTITRYGRNNQNFLIPYKQANEAYGALEGSKFISNWIENNVTQSQFSAPLIHLLTGASSVAGPVVGALTAGAPGSLLAAGGYQGGRLAYRIAKSPTLAKIYGNTIKAAAKEDVKAFTKYAKELDDAIKQEEDREVWEFVD